MGENPAECWCVHARSFPSGSVTGKHAARCIFYKVRQRNHHTSRRRYGRGEHSGWFCAAETSRVRGNQAAATCRADGMMMAKRQEIVRRVSQGSSLLATLG